MQLFSKLTTFDKYPYGKDECYSLIQLFEKQVEAYPDRKYCVSNDGKDEISFTYQQVGKIVTLLAIKLAKDQGLVNNGKPVGFTSFNTFSAHVYQLALQKLRIPALILSPTKTHEEIENLLNITETEVALIFDPMLKSLCSIERIKFIDAVDYEKLLDEEIDKTIVFEPHSADDYEKVAIILHTSGSTSLPKQRRITNRALIKNIQQVPLSPSNYDQSLLPGEGSVAMSLFPGTHMVGFNVAFSMLLFGGTMVFLPPLSPPELVLSTLIKEKCNFLYIIPPSLEAIAKKLQAMKTTEEEGFEEYLNGLKKLNFIAYGGGALPKEIGQYIQSNGVNICNFYGMTEIGIAMSANIKKGPSKNYELLRFINGIEEHARLDAYSKEEDTYELVILEDCDTLAEDIAENGEYRTGDLFKKVDVDGTEWWQSVGRLDDNLVLSSGLNFIPLLLEEALRAHRMVKACAVVVGDASPCTVALIQLDWTHESLADIDSSNGIPDSVQKQVRTIVRECNRKVQKHGQVEDGMIYILPHGESLPTTDKGTVRRREAVKIFGAVIKTKYDERKNLICVLKDDLPEDPRAWTLEQTQDYIIKVASEVRGDICITFPNESLIELGFNSNNFTRLHNELKRRFTKSAVDYQWTISITDFYRYENPAAIADIIFRHASTAMPDQYVEQQYGEANRILEKILKKANKDFVVATSTSVKKEDKDVVLLTGATGSVGSFMLRDLLLSPKVKKVIALVRENKGVTLKERLCKSFEDRSLDIKLLDFEKLEVLPLNLDADLLGFEQATYDNLKSEVTIIQACAWPLNFNHPIEQYEKNCIGGLYNLLKFASRPKNPMQVHMISSVSASPNSHIEGSVQEKPLRRDPHVAMPMGYALSKYIAEHLFNFLTEKKGMPCYIERLGQICGDSDNGAWNMTEQYPIMFATGNELGKMPLLDTQIDWIPVNYAAKSIVEIMLNTSNKCPSVEETIFHIVNPNPVHWKDVLKALKDHGMKFDTVPLGEWIDIVRNNPNTPAAKLLPFYETVLGPYFTGLPLWETKKTEKVAETLTKVPELSNDLFESYFKYWSLHHFINLPEKKAQNGE